MRTIRMAWAAVVISTIGATPAPASAYCHLTTVDPNETQLCATTGRTLAWFDRCSTIKLLPRGKQDIASDVILGTIATSFDTWNAVRCDGDLVGLVATVSDVPASEDSPRHGLSGGNENVVMFVDSQALWLERLNPAAAIGLTSVFHSKKTGQILGADMEINDWSVRLGICGRACGVGITDLQNVLTHEAGHYYGLGHVADSTATMYYEAPARDIAKRDLGADDITGLCDTYPAGSFDAACTGGPLADMFKDNGCGCSAVGGIHSIKAWLIGLPLTLLLALRIARRRRRSA